MNKFLKLTLILTLFTSTLGFSQKESTDGNLIEKDCKIFHKGVFKYAGSKDEIKVVIKGKSHTEFHNNGKYIIKSKLEWVNDCEYNMTMLKVTIPNFPYQKGDVMNVKINEIKGNEIYSTSTVKGAVWKNKLLKVT
jgi:hypothetical protein